MCVDVCVDYDSCAFMLNVYCSPDLICCDMLLCVVMVYVYVCVGVV